MTDDAQRARRRAHNAHALARCNAMGRTAGSILWQPLQTKDGKWFMPDGAELSEVPIEWRSERLDTILDEMEETQRAIAFLNDAESNPGKTYVETLDVEKWKAETGAQFEEGKARLRVHPPTKFRVAAAPIEFGDPVIIDDLGQVWPAVASRPSPPPSTISLEDLEKAIVEPRYRHKGSCSNVNVLAPPHLQGRNAKDCPCCGGVLVTDDPLAGLPAFHHSDFRQYRRSQIAELRSYIPLEPMDGISVSGVDRDAGSPKPGDMIARNPKNHADQWLVAEQYFKDNFEPV